MQLDIADVTKVYQSGITAVREVSMRIGPGVLGLLGPNGAGKSSLMRILATVTQPTHGRVTWNDTDIAGHPDELRRVLGYLPQDFGLYPHLTAPEMLSYFAAVKGLSGRSARRRIDELLGMVNLTEARKRPLGKYSGGMRQRVGIAQALLNDPQVLIVDEPTAGLDPEERMRIRDMLGDLAVDRVVILSTHIVSDVEAVAEDIAILARGRLCRRGTPEELLRDVRGQVWDVLVDSGDLSAFRERHLVSRAVRTPDGTRARVLSPNQPAADATPSEPDLEDAYLWVVRGQGQPVDAGTQGGAR
jgi:ABC-2 type transport system ATP-binding protein